MLLSTTERNGALPHRPHHLHGRNFDGNTFSGKLVVHLGAFHTYGFMSLDPAVKCIRLYSRERRLFRLLCFSLIEASVRCCAPHFSNPGRWFKNSCKRTQQRAHMADVRTVVGVCVMHSVMTMSCCRCATHVWAHAFGAKVIGTNSKAYWGLTIGSSSGTNFAGSHRGEPACGKVALGGCGGGRRE